MGYLLILVNAVLGGASTVLNKKFQTSFKETTLNFVKYNFINALFACFFLFALNKFSFSFSLPTLYFGFVFALVVICSLVLNLYALKFASIPLVSIASTAGSVIASAVFDLIYQGSLPITTCISVALMLIALILPYVKTQITFNKATVPICLAYFLTSASSSIVMKFFTITPTVTDSGSFFILTNAVIVAFTLLMSLAFLLSKKSSAREILKPFPLKLTANVLSRTAISNICSLLSISAIAVMPLAVYSVSSSALSLVFAFTISLLIFKEKTSPRQIISVIIAVCAIIVTIF